MSTILKTLQHERVVSFYYSPENNTIQAVEECDEYFSYNLSKLEMLELIQELTKLTQLLKD